MARPPLSLGAHSGGRQRGLQQSPPGQVEFVFEGGNTVAHVNTEGGNAPEMEIELLGQINLTAGDFRL
jgi:hypothetical protein